MTGLADALQEEIRRAGPMPVARFMDVALNDPAYGYYRTRDPLGAGGDFITAPEISQMFGELIGAWLAVAWQQAGSPALCHLVELGPGRGTLLADALRATKRLTGFHAALRIHLVETNPVLRDAQAKALTGFRPAWHDDVTTLPDGPLLLVANEFFDALPIDQYVHASGAWHERRVGLAKNDRGGDVFAFVAGPVAKVLFPAAPDGAIREDSPATHAVARQVAARLAAFGGAALIVDYGYAEEATGDSLQAMRGHGRHDPLADPGEADLTAHVNFAALAAVARQAGAVAYGPVPQGQLLESLGIAARADMLSRAAPDQAGKIGLAVKRLIAPTEMGTLFKALALTGPRQPTPAGFPEFRP
ncbi:MAG TPA: SAM-dependent methyltransferase [Alphaproteobacteria bacterium]|jgi:NADH dehydrogenase [ubiquinone] 1 alpha subcomplex assembly factor 7